jgi:hypothetical protein
MSWEVVLSGRRGIFIGALIRIKRAFSEKSIWLEIQILKE